MRPTMRPRTITDLAEVPEDERDGYVPAEGGGFKLHPVLAEDWDRYDAELAAQDAKIAKRLAALEALTVKKALGEALEKAGVKASHAPLVTAYLREKMKFTVEDIEEDNPKVAVADAYGEVGVEFAVNTWLATDDAEAYRPPVQVADGPMMERLRQLRARMQ